MVHVLVAAKQTWGRLATSAPAVEGTLTLPRRRPVPRLPEKPRRGTGRSRHGQGNHGAVRASPRFTHLHQLHPISSLIRVTSPPQHQASRHHYLPPLSAECDNPTISLHHPLTTSNCTSLVFPQCIIHNHYSYIIFIIIPLFISLYSHTHIIHHPPKFNICIFITHHPPLKLSIHSSNHTYEARLTHP